MLNILTSLWTELSPHLKRYEVALLRRVIKELLHIDLGMMNEVKHLS